MSRYIVTPWKSTSDLLTVRGQLYRVQDAAQDQRRYAVDRIMAWRLRGSLPHAVESTALLIDAFLHHDIAANSSFSIRAVYSAAFCRFVTGFCDIGRNRERSLEPSSMLDIARQIDMPEDFVALRHEATHEDLPGEQRIVAACEAALHWLWNVYWSRLDVVEPAVDAARMNNRIVDCRSVVKRIFREYRVSKKQVLKKSMKPELLQQQVINSTGNLTSLCRDDTSIVDSISSEIIRSNWLVPTDREIGSSLDGAYLIWDDLLKYLCETLPGFLIALSDQLLHAVVDGDNESYREAYAAWLKHICCSPDWAKVVLGLGLDTRVMRQCLLYTGSWTSDIAASLLKHGEKDFVEEWSSLFEAAEMSADVQQADEQHDRLNEEVQTISGWYRAVLPPTQPLGIVAV